MKTAINIKTQKPSNLEVEVILGFSQKKCKFKRPQKVTNTTCTFLKITKQEARWHCGFLDILLQDECGKKSKIFDLNM